MYTGTVHPHSDYLGLHPFREGYLFCFWGRGVGGLISHNSKKPNCFKIVLKRVKKSL